jgi:hypothetical protein
VWLLHSAKAGWPCRIEVALALAFEFLPVSLSLISADTAWKSLVSFPSWTCSQGGGQGWQVWVLVGSLMQEVTC